MHWYPDMMGWVGGAGMFLFWAVVILVIVVLVRWLAAPQAGRGAAGESPMEILKRRYASGEIDKAEFEEKKKNLQG